MAEDAASDGIESMDPDTATALPPSISVGVTAEVVEQWSWAAANARIPQIAALTLTVPEALENVRVVVSVEDGADVFGRTVASEGSFPAGVTPPRSVYVPLSARAMAGVDERRAAESVIRVEDVASSLLLGEYRQEPTPRQTPYRPSSLTG